MRRLAILLLLAPTACGDDQKVAAASLGETLFSSPKVSASAANAFSCSTCHQVGTSMAPATDGTHPGRIDPGFDLSGVVHRPSWWGGYKTTFLDSMNYCITIFMGGAALTETDPRAKELYEYLAADHPEPKTTALPMTVVKQADPLATLKGDATRGLDVYARACKRCHGEPHTGVGRLGTRPSIVPDDTAKFFPTNTRDVVVEKIRHGRFFNIGGYMPLYPVEAISDNEIADILAYLGL
jgi:thiosulfate dehydrogenase